MKSKNRATAWGFAAIALVAIVWLALAVARRPHEAPAISTSAEKPLVTAPRSNTAPLRAAASADDAARATDSAAPARPVAPIRDWTADLRKSWDDPAVRAAALRDALGRIEQRYGRFFQTLRNFSPAQLDALKHALAEADLALGRQYLPLSSNETDADRRARITGAEQLKLQQAEQLRAQLGDETFARLSDYDRALPYQQNVESIANTMRSTGLPVDEQTQQKILNTYADVLGRVAAAASKDLPGVDLATLSEADRQALHARQMERFDTQLAESMAKVLDPVAFRAFMDAQLRLEDSRN